MRFPNARLIQFAKSPRSGQMKTRLASVLDPDARLVLHRLLVRHCHKTLEESDLAPVSVWSNEIDKRHDAFWRSCDIDSLRLQEGNDLGERMQRAFYEHLGPQGNAAFAVLVGSDCPQLDADILGGALNALAHEAEVVLGPALDGGYYLIGLRRADPYLFQNIPWGTDQVFSVTMKRCHELGLRVTVMRPLSDVDRPSDLSVLTEMQEIFPLEEVKLFNLLKNIKI